MRSLLKFITCGSVDDGKSTLIGHILYDSKLLYADQEKALELDSKVGSRGGAIDYSLLLDGLMAEREQGITIDVAYRYFTTDNRSFIVADTPGHEEYTRNMAVGASFADLAVILIDAKQGVLVQTRRHARICALMGIKYFVFAVNKMDLIGYDEKRFREIENQIAELYVGAAELYRQAAQEVPEARQAVRRLEKTGRTQRIAGWALVTYAILMGAGLWEGSAGDRIIWLAVAAFPAMAGGCCLHYGRRLAPPLSRIGRIALTVLGAVLAFLFVVGVVVLLDPAEAVDGASVWLTGCAGVGAAALLLSGLRKPRT